MSKYVIDSTTLTSVANAIRGKDGTSAPIQVSDFATRITNIPTGGGGGSVTFTGWLGALGVSGKVDTSASQNSMAYVPPVFEVGDTITLNYKVSSGGTQRNFDMILYKVSTSAGGQTLKANILTKFSTVSGQVTDSYSFTVEEGEDYGYVIFLRINNKTATTSSVNHQISITKCEVS